MQMVVRDIMTSSPATVHFEQSIDEAIKILMAHSASEIFVVDHQNQLRGAVPEVEILKAELNGIDGKTAIDTITCRSIATVRPNDPVAILFPRFRTGYCRQLAVTENGKLVGQIHRRDVIRLMHTLRRLELSVNDIIAPEIPQSTSEDLPSPNYVVKTTSKESGALFSGLKQS